MPVRQTPRNIAACLFGAVLLASCSPAAEDYGHRVLLAPYEDAERWKHTSVPVYPKSDRDEIVRMLEEAANAGDYRAMANLAFMQTGYAWGGHKPDMDRAVLLLETAAEHGDALAEANLGILYIFTLNNGRGDRPEAVRLLRLSADQHFGLGEFGLGFMYQAGWGGLEKDLDEARRLLRLARDHGEPLAAVYLKAIS